MQESILLLNDTSQLLRNIHLSSLSVLIFTAAWSVESQYARDALRMAVPLTPCHASIRLYELSWPPPSPVPYHPTKPRAVSSALSNRFPDALKHLNSIFAGMPIMEQDHELAHRNITASVPWLPCIQVYVNDSQGITPFTYLDSFDQFSIASFLRRNCPYHPPQVLDTHIALPSQDRSFWNHFKVTPVSRDQFAQFLNQVGNDDQSSHCGLLIVLRGGFSTLLHKHLHVWKALSIFVDTSSDDSTVSNSLNDSSWVISVVDAATDTNFVQSIGITTLDLSNISLIAVDPLRDNMRIITCDERCSLPSWLHQTLGRFCTQKREAQSFHPPSPSSQSRLLSFVHKPNYLSCHLQPVQSYLSLNDWINFSYNGEMAKPLMIWLVVYQTWCAFCQRILGLYERFATMVQNEDTADLDVYVVLNSNCSLLPEWIDGLVDGFPTILLLRQWKQTSTIEEYKAPHDLTTLKQFHDHHKTFIQEL